MFPPRSKPTIAGQRIEGTNGAERRQEVTPLPAILDTNSTVGHGENNSGEPKGHAGQMPDAI
jgi:hypothetical protein